MGFLVGLATATAALLYVPFSVVGRWLARSTLARETGQAVESAQKQAKGLSPLRLVSEIALLTARHRQSRVDGRHCRRRALTCVQLKCNAVVVTDAQLQIGVHAAECVARTPLAQRIASANCVKAMSFGRTGAALTRLALELAAKRRMASWYDSLDVFRPRTRRGRLLRRRSMKRNRAMVVRDRLVGLHAGRLNLVNTASKFQR
jgi:hypothetical protein